MPLVSRIMIRSSLACLMVAVGMGSLLLVHKAWPLHAALWQLLPLHIELALMGWVVQFTLGTAYWMLPRHLEGPPRGSPRAALGMALLLNGGILLVLLYHLYTVGWMHVAGRLLETGAVALFIALHWKRVVSYTAS
ncbi:MAG: hypothetical protein U5K31_13620 [Balneolaceae bacterium]|nr:hypothetical protein [Balneolaceae bacterium]